MNDDRYHNNYNILVLIENIVMYNYYYNLYLSIYKLGMTNIHAL